MIILYSSKKEYKIKLKHLISHSEEGVDIFSLKEVNGWYVNLQLMKNGHPLQEDGEELISYLRFFNIRNVCSGLLEEYHTRDDNRLKLKYTQKQCALIDFFLFFVGPLFFFFF